MRDAIVGCEGAFVGELRVVSVKVPDEVYKEMVLRVPAGDRSSFVRDAIVEKLERTPRPDRVLELERRVDRVEKEFSEVRKYLADLELLTFERGKANPYVFGVDDVDRRLIDYLVHYKGATTPELAEYLGVNRWLVLNRLRRLQRVSRRQLGRSVVEYYAGERSGKKKAWWVVEELVES
jgi:hypothetical protein